MKVFVTILCLSVAGLCHGQLSGSVQGSASIPGLSNMGNMISNAMSVGTLAANAGLNMAQRGSDAAFSGLNQGHRVVSDMKTNAIQQGTQGVVQGISVGASMAGNVPIVGEPLRQAIQSKADVAGNIGASIQNMHGQFSTATGNMITSAQGKVNSGISAMAASINNGFGMAQNAVSTGVNAAGNMAAQGQALAAGGINAGMNAAGSAAAQGQAAMSGAMQTGAALAGSVQSGINAGVNAAGSMAAQGQAAMNGAVERGTAAAGSVQSGINAGVNTAGAVVSQAQSTSTGAGTGSSGSQSTWSALAGRLASSLTG